MLKASEMVNGVNYPIKTNIDTVIIDGIVTVLSATKGKVDGKPIYFKNYSDRNGHLIKSKSFSSLTKLLKD